MGANRAYGLASCLLVLSFGMIWRMVESPVEVAGYLAPVSPACCSRSASILTDYFCARCWPAEPWWRFDADSGKRSWSLVGIGAVSGASMVIYLPIIRQGSVYLPLIRIPFFDLSALWHGLGDALAARSSADPFGANGPQIWFWVELAVGRSQSSPSQCSGGAGIRRRIRGRARRVPPRPEPISRCSVSSACFLESRGVSYFW